MSTRPLEDFPSQDNMEGLTKKTAAKQPKTVNAFVGFFFMVNFCLGTGFLGVPYSFFYSGYLAATPVLLVVGFATWLTGSWYVECMARAQALHSYKQEIESSDDSTTTVVTTGTKKPLEDGNLPACKHPNFEITVHRCFEPVDMCEIFFGPWLKYIYIIILCVYCLFASWSFCTVAGSAWASNIPYNFGGIVECADGAFHHTLLPSDPGCLRAYYFSLFLFGVIVVTLSMLDLKEQAVIQIVMGLLRFFTVGAILVYTIVKLTTGDDICEPEVPTSEYTEDSTWTHFYNVSVNATRYTSLQDIVVKFDIKGLLAATPVLTYAFIVHQGIPSLTHPIKQKRSLHWLMMAMFGTGTICYLSLGVVVPLWFKADTQETITLNFVEFTKPQNHHPTQLKVLAYYLILFPSLDVMSAFPLMIHVIVNNTYALFRNTILFGIRLITKKNIKSLRFDWVFKLVFRFFTAILPLLLALTMANLIYVLKFAGLFGFFMCFFFPSALQIQSIRVCKKTFGPNSLKIDGVPSLKVPPRVNEKAPLIQNVRSGHFRSFRKTYMTPYSFFILSHPITACVVILIGVCLFGLTLASWFTAPVKVTCAL